MSLLGPTAPALDLDVHGPAALSHTWDRQVSWDDVPKLASLGVADFLLDPFLLGLDGQPLQEVLKDEGGVIAAHGARLWVFESNIPLPPGARHVLHAREVTASGGHAVQELGWLLNQVLTWAEGGEAGPVGVGITCDREFFKSIAKHRAFTVIARAGLEAMGKGALWPQLTRVAAVGWRDFSAYDAGSNVLRNSTAVAAGLIARAGVVQSLPHNLLLETSHADIDRAVRLALTSQLVLQQESFLGEVEDAGAGSRTLEELTRQLAEAAWKEMQRLRALPATERAADAARAAGESWRRTQELFRTRRLVQAGVNDFPEPSERVRVRARFLDHDHVRLGRAFEELRLRAQALSAPLKVALPVVGDYAALQARLGFTRNFFELLGAQTVDPGTGLDVSAAAAWAQAQNAPVTAWVAADADHPNLGPCPQQGRHYLAGKTPWEGAHNLHAGMDVWQALEALVSWAEGRP